MLPASHMAFTGTMEEGVLSLSLGGGESADSPRPPMTPPGVEGLGTLSLLGGVTCY